MAETVREIRYWFEDFQPGQTFELGSREVTHEELVSFALYFDPQRFHVDEAAARETHFGGLVASGWHTGAVYQRLHVDGLLNQSSCVGSPGVDEVKFVRPVRPGDVLTARMEILDAVPSRTKPNRGTVTQRSEVLNQHGDVVMTMVARAMFLRRPDDAGADGPGAADATARAD
jgi:acyl dehydratase